MLPDRRGEALDKPSQSRPVGMCAPLGRLRPAFRSRPPLPRRLVSRAKRSWRGPARCFLCSPRWVVVRCARSLPFVRNGHVSGALVVRVGRLRARRIELSTRAPLQSLPARPSRPGGPLGILCCVPIAMAIGCLAVPLLSHSLRGCWADHIAPRAPSVPADRRGRVGARALDRALGCGTFRGRGVSAPSARRTHFVPRRERRSCPVSGPRKPHRRRAGARAVPDVAKECYLVDPASSHMLVSKIKPCMCKYEQIQTVKLRMAH